MINNEDPFDGVLPFVRVADELSFRRAAARLGVTPAAVSRSVQRIEARAGARLVERTTRSVRLTAEGARFAARCREALAQMAAAAAELSLARAPQGTVAVSATPVLARLVVPALARFLVRQPAIRVELSLTDRLVRFVEDEIDVALRVGPVVDENVIAHPLRAPRWTTVAAPEYLARRGVPASLAELEAHACVCYAPPRGRVRPWVFAGPVTSFQPRAVLEVDHGDLLIDAARAGGGVAQLLDFMAADDLREGRLVALLPELAAPGPVVQVVYPPSLRALPRVRALVGFLREELR